MSSVPDTFDSDNIDLSKDALWERLYRLMRPFVRKFVYSCNFAQGQEEDNVNDLLQDMAVRILKYGRRADRGEGPPIGSIGSLAYIAAQSCCKDWYRKERRLVHLSDDDPAFEEASNDDSQLDLAEIAMNNVYQESVFKEAVNKIKGFAPKMRQALLIDLADLLPARGDPTPLQRAFLQQGINVIDYQGRKPLDSKLRGRHASLLSQAYRHMRMNRLPF